MLLCDLQYDEERLLIVCRLITSPAPSGLRRSLSWPNSTRKKRRWQGTSLSSRRPRRWVTSRWRGGGGKVAGNWPVCCPNRLPWHRLVCCCGGWIGKYHWGLCALLNVLLLPILGWKTTSPHILLEGMGFLKTFKRCYLFFFFDNSVLVNAYEIWEIA